MRACSDLPEHAHVLLTHITKTKVRRAKQQVARGGLSDWQTALAPVLEAEQVRLAFEDLLECRVLWRPELPGGGYGPVAIHQPCGCNSTGAVIAPYSKVSTSSPADSSGLGGGTPFGGSATILRSRLRRANAQVGAAIEEPSDEELDDALALFQNGAEDDPRPTRESPGQKLVRYFLAQVPAAAERQGIEIMPTAISAAALGGQVRRMLQGGMSEEEIVSMINLFCKQYGRYHKPDADPAKVFLANRRRLFAQAQEQSTFITETDPHRFARQAAKKGRRYSTLDSMTRSAT